MHPEVSFQRMVCPRTRVGEETLKLEVKLANMKRDPFPIYC